MKLIKNTKQKDNLAKLFYDLSKIVFAVLIIGQLAKPFEIAYPTILLGISMMLFSISIALFLDNKELTNG